MELFSKSERIASIFMSILCLIIAISFAKQACILNQEKTVHHFEILVVAAVFFLLIACGFIYMSTRPIDRDNKYY